MGSEWCVFLCAQVEAVLSAVEGSLTPLEQLTHLSDQQAIRKVHV